MKLVLIVLAVLVIGLGVWREVAHRQLRAQVEPMMAEKEEWKARAVADSAEAERLEEQADSLAAELDTARVRARRDSIEEARVRRDADAAIARARAVADPAADELRTTLQVVAPALIPVFDTYVLARDRIEDAHELKNRALGTVNESLRLQLIAQAQLLVVTDSASGFWESAYLDERAALAISEDLTEFWEREANPGFLLGIWKDAPVILVSAAAGAALACVAAC